MTVAFDDPEANVAAPFVEWVDRTVGMITEETSATPYEATNAEVAVVRVVLATVVVPFTVALRPPVAVTDTLAEEVVLVTDAEADTPLVMEEARPTAGDPL